MRLPAQVIYDIVDARYRDIYQAKSKAKGEASEMYYEGQLTALAFAKSLCKEHENAG